MRGSTDTTAVRSVSGSPSILLRAAWTTESCTVGSMVVVICSPPVLISCSLMPDCLSSAITWFLISPTGPMDGSFSSFSFASGGCVSGNCNDARLAGSSAPMSTIPSST